MSEYHRHIQFSIPDCKIVSSVPEKIRDFASYVPNDWRYIGEYVYEEEEAYYQGYKDAYYAVTKKKGGWDCMRHYEILANGCIPYFLDLEKCPRGAMFR